MSQAIPDTIESTQSTQPTQPIEQSEPTAIADSTPPKPKPQAALWSTKLQDPTLTALADYSARDLARALLERLSLHERDWHRLKGDRRRRAQEQIAAALVFMLADNDLEAHQRLTHALDWLDRRVSASACPDHSSRSPKPKTQPRIKSPSESQTEPENQTPDHT